MAVDTISIGNSGKMKGKENGGRKGKRERKKKGRRNEWVVRFILIDKTTGTFLMCYGTRTVPKSVIKLQI